MEKRRHDTEDEIYSQTPLLLTGPGLPIRADIRQWIMQGGEPQHLMPSGFPLWVHTMLWKDTTATEEAIAVGAHANMKDLWRNGFLWWASETGMEPDQVMSHLPALDATWWHPNADGLTPFHHPRLHPSIAHAMACRWWSDGLSWRQMQRYGDPIETARENKRWDLVSLWQGNGPLPWFTLP